LPEPIAGIDVWDAPRPVPLQRWDVEVASREVVGLVPPRFGSFMEGVSEFDAEVFSISRWAHCTIT
jgi:acyl transferase domain-containing protein